MARKARPAVNRRATLDNVRRSWDFFEHQHARKNERPAGSQNAPVGSLALIVVGIVIAVLAALFVLFHARYRRLSYWSMFFWVLGTLLLMIVVFPIYLLVHGPDPKQDEDDT